MGQRDYKAGQYIDKNNLTMMSKATGGINIETITVSLIQHLEIKDLKNIPCTRLNKSFYVCDITFLLLIPMKSVKRLYKGGHHELKK